MRSFTVQIYDCTQCPHADHDNGVCLEVLNQYWQTSRLDPNVRARLAYQENCMELCDSCPKLQ